MPNWDEIRTEWETSKITLKALAEKHGVKLGTLKSRKSREKWAAGNSKRKVATKLKKDATQIKKDASRGPGAPKGNKNAVGNKGGAPKGNSNAKGNPGGRAPFGNKNAVTTGEYETIMWDYLDEYEKELFYAISTDPILKIDITIKELSIRQRRMMGRIERIEKGLTDKQRSILKELRKVKDIVETQDEKTGKTKTVPVQKEKLIVTEVEETELRAIDDILNIEEALTRITNQLVRAIKQKYDMERSKAEQSLKIMQMKANIDKTKAETSRLKGDDGTEYEDDGFLDAIKSSVDIWDDKNE